MASSRPNTAAAEKIRADALNQMDLTKIVRAYITTMINTTPGYKAMILDKETMRICSSLIGRTEFAEHNVVHVEKVDAEEKKPHPELKAICFMRPTRGNISWIKSELRSPRFQQYHIFFTHLVSTLYLQELAEADALREQIQEIQEFYGDFVVVDHHHFMVPCSNSELFISPKPLPAASEQIDRCVQGLSALFLALRRRPIIRYQRGSDSAQRLAQDLYSLTYKQQYQVFDFGARSHPVVLLLDRKDDPITPLLTQWTYQAMLHELIGIEDLTVELKSSKVLEKFRSEKLVLDPRFDDFYRKHQYRNYGEVGASVKALVEQFQGTAQMHSKVETLEDMRRFVSEHSDFERLQANISKHVNIMTELSEIISTRDLMNLSPIEQDLASTSSGLSVSEGFDEVMKLLRLPGTSDRDRVRLVALFALRFEEDTMRVRQLQDFLVTAGVRDREPRLFGCVEALLRYAGATKRAGDLFGNKSFLGKTRGLLKPLQGGVVVENVYTQHVPLVSELLGQLVSDRLDLSAYPYHGSQDEVMAWAGAAKRQPPREVILFILGGSTHEEAKAVMEFNEKNPGFRAILGGTAVLNSEAFLSALMINSSAGSGMVSIDIR